MNDQEVLIIDDDPQSAAILRRTFAEAGLEADSAGDAFTAMEKLRERHYRAVILDPTIRQRLNGYAVLNFLEIEQPETIDRLFLLTGMSEQTIRRTAPTLLPRLFRKPTGYSKLAAAVVEACARDSHRTARSPRKSVLLVEDDCPTADAMIRVLDQLGYAVERCWNGREALDLMGKREFDAIMLDLVLPHVDGFSVLEHFRAEGGRLRNVIVITGMPDKYLEELDAGALGGILHKPVDVSQLERLLSDCVHGRVAFEPGGEMPSIDSGERLAK